MNLLQLYWQSIFISLVTFGGGSQALYEAFAIQRLHWITYTDLSAFLAFGYSTPGPAVFGTSAFIGFRLYGVIGTFVGTLGIFTSPWLLALVASKYGSRVIETTHLRHFGHGVGLVAAGLLAAVAMNMGKQSDLGVLTLVMGIGAFYASLKKVNPLVIVLVGLGAGIIWR